MYKKSQKDKFKLVISKNYYFQSKCLSLYNLI